MTETYISIREKRYLLSNGSYNKQNMHKKNFFFENTTEDAVNGTLKKVFLLFILKKF